MAVGISKNFTDPTALRLLVEFAELRIVPDDSTRIFHPKYYCFHGPKTTCWVGSANLTCGGFGGNVEVVHEFDVTCEDDRNWFERLWETLDPNPMPAIMQYEKNYKAPKRTPRPARLETEPVLPSLSDIETWADFVEGLRACDAYYRHHNFDWDVLGETHSWLHTIRTGGEVAQLKDWANLTKRECRILSGSKAQDDEGKWALLGWVRAGGVYIFNPERMPEVGPTRAQVRNQLKRVLGLRASEISAVAHDALHEIRGIQRVEGPNRGIGPAAATRWLTLARPDCLVPLNKISSSKLGQLSGLPQDSAKLANVYSDLLEWLYERPWFNEFQGGQPSSSWEREIWSCRAALIDAFLCDPKRDSG